MLSCFEGTFNTVFLIECRGQAYGVRVRSRPQGFGFEPVAKEFFTTLLFQNPHVTDAQARRLLLIETPIIR